MNGKTTAAFEHNISPWLQILMPILMALGLWIMNNMSTGLADLGKGVDRLTDQYHEVDKKVSALEIKESNIKRIESQTSKRLDQHDDRLKNFSGRISKNEQKILIHQRDNHGRAMLKNLNQQ